MRHELSWWADVLVDIVVCVGLLVVMPLGLRLIDQSLVGRLRGLWYVGAAPAAVSVWLPRGWPAAALAACYLVIAGLLLVHGVRLLARRWPRPREFAVATAMCAPIVGAGALVAERAGHRLLGFDLDILALTVAHFHYAGFVAALVAGLVCRIAGDSAAARAAALSVPAGTGTVLAGFFVGGWLELLGTAILTAGMWLVGWLTWRHGLPAGPDRLTRALLGISAIVLIATLLLALSWALGEATGLAHLPMTWMVATHGLGNAVGFALCAMIGWRRLGRHPA